MNRVYYDGYKIDYYKKKNKCIYSSDAAIEELFNREIFSWELWGKIYRRNIISQIIYDESISVLEDLDRGIDIFVNAYNVYYSSHVSYNYYYNENSIINSNNVIRSKELKVYDRILKTYKFKKNIMNKIYHYYLLSLKAKINEMVFQDVKLYECEIINYQNVGRKIIKKMDLDCYGDLSMVNVFYLDYGVLLKYSEGYWGRINKWFSNNCMTEKKIYLYGVGKYGYLCAKILRKLGIDWENNIVSENQNIHIERFFNKKIVTISDFTEKDAYILMPLNKKIIKKYHHI